MGVSENLQHYLYVILQQYFEALSFVSLILKVNCQGKKGQFMDMSNPDRFHI